jgi:lipid-binding SYLF domain-containing protein
MTRSRISLVAGLLLLILAGTPVWATDQPVQTVDAAANVVHDFASLYLKSIPQALMQDAVGVAVLPHVVKAALLLDREGGRGVILARGRDGSWSNPVFITLKGHGIGGAIGVETIDLVLVFRSHKSFDRALAGKVTLGGDLAVAAGKVGREAEVASDRLLKADVVSYSRSRGLFVGISLEGTRLQVDEKANEVFYHMAGGRAADVLALPPLPEPAGLRIIRYLLVNMSQPATSPPVVVVPMPSVPPPNVIIPASSPPPPLAK